MGRGGGGEGEKGLSTRSLLIFNSAITTTTTKTTIIIDRNYSSTDCIRELFFVFP